MLKTIAYKARLLLCLVILAPVLLTIFLAWIFQKIERGVNAILRWIAKQILILHDKVAPPKHKGGW